MLGRNDTRPALSTRTWTVAGAGLLIIGLLTACGGTTPPPTEPAEDTSQLGIDWVQLAAAEVADADGSYRSFSGGGELWIVDADREAAVLHGTVDGAVWRTIDLREHGLPDDAALASTDCQAGFAWDHGDGFTIVYYTSYGGSHPSGIALQAWLVEVRGDEVEMSSGRAIGLERMPAPENGYDFRTTCISSVIERDGKRLIIGEGQWWQPYNTGDSSAFVAFEESPGQWRVHSTTGSEFLGGEPQISLAAVHDVDGVLVAVSGHYGTVGVWYSSDGRDWRRADVPDLPADAPNIAVVRSESGISFAATSGEMDTTLTVWSSADGSTWAHETLISGDDMVVLRSFVAGAAKQVLLATTWDTSTVTWHGWYSADGGGWDPLPDEIPPGTYIPDDITAHAGGLVSVSAGAIYVSGLPEWVVAAG